MKIAVIGAGLMGSGITQQCAQAGFSTVNIDAFAAAQEKAKATLAALFERKVAKGRLTTEEADAILSRISYSTDYAAAGEADIVIEAVPEKIDLKKAVFKQLDAVCKAEALLLSNTSGLSISEIGSVTKRPQQVMGTHFFYPAPVMKLVELIRGLATSDEVYTQAKAFMHSLGKTTVDAPEYPGFIVNRILVPMQNEAAYMVMEGCSPEDVDTAMKLGTNMPMGPCELTDFVGIDVMLATMTGLYEGFHDSKYRPCPLLERMVKAGRLGRKSGQGFYTYK